MALQLDEHAEFRIKCLTQCASTDEQCMRFASRNTGFCTQHLMKFKNNFNDVLLERCRQSTVLVSPNDTDIDLWQKCLSKGVSYDHPDYDAENDTNYLTNLRLRCQKLDIAIDPSWDIRTIQKACMKCRYPFKYPDYKERSSLDLRKGSESNAPKCPEGYRFTTSDRDSGTFYANSIGCCMPKNIESLPKRMTYKDIKKQFEESLDTFKCTLPLPKIKKIREILSYMWDEVKYRTVDGITMLFVQVSLMSLKNRIEILNDRLEAETSKDLFTYTSEVQDAVKKDTTSSKGGTFSDVFEEKVDSDAPEKAKKFKNLLKRLSRPFRKASLKIGKRSTEIAICMSMNPLSLYLISEQIRIIVDNACSKLQVIVMNEGLAAAIGEGIIVNKKRRALTRVEIEMFIADFVEKNYKKLMVLFHVYLNNQIDINTMTDRIINSFYNSDIIQVINKFSYGVFNFVTKPFVKIIVEGATKAVRDAFVGILISGLLSQMDLHEFFETCLGDLVRYQYAAEEFYSDKISEFVKTKNTDAEIVNTARDVVLRMMNDGSIKPTAAGAASKVLTEDPKAFVMSRRGSVNTRLLRQNSAKLRSGAFAPIKDMVRRENRLEAIQNLPQEILEDEEAEELESILEDME